MQHTLTLTKGEAYLQEPMYTLLPTWLMRPPRREMQKEIHANIIEGKCAQDLFSEKGTSTKPGGLNHLGRERGYGKESEA